MFKKYVLQCIKESLNSILKSNENIPEHIILHYHQHALPNDNKSDRILNFVLKLHRNGKIKTDNSDELKQHLTRLSNNNAISSLKNVSDMEELRNVSNNYNRSKKIYNSDTMKVVQHIGHSEAIKAAELEPDNSVKDLMKLKGKAAWCLSSSNKKGEDDYNFYTEHDKHPFYTITTNKRKYAFVSNPNIKEYGPEGVFQNEFNETVNIHDFIKKYPEIKKVPEIYGNIKPHEELSDNDLADLGYRASKYGDYQDIDTLVDLIPKLPEHKLNIIRNNIIHPDYIDPNFKERVKL